MSTVYFVKLGKPIKIGVTMNLKKRLKSFQTTVIGPQVLLTVPGGRELEQKLHSLLQEVRIGKTEMFITIGA